MFQNVSIVIPCYNSADTLATTVMEVHACLAPHCAHEFVLVNDGSSDGTWDVIQQLGQQINNVVGIDHMRNFGEHSAVMTGLRHATGEAAVIVDDDGQHLPSEILKLLVALDEGQDVVYGRFAQKRHSLWRNLGSKLNGIVGNLVLNKPRDIYLSSFKALRRPIIDELVKYSAPYLYLDGFLFWLTDRIGQVTVEHRERQHGRSNYNLRRLLKLHINLVTGFSILPLRVATLFGFLIAAVGLFLAVMFSIEKILNPDLQVGWASLIVTILIIGGIQLVMLGIVGEYIGRVFLMINRKPQAVIRDTTK